MARIFITGSTEGLGRAAAQSLIDGGHGVVLHARPPDRALGLADLAPRSIRVVTADLRSAARWFATSVKRQERTEASAFR